MPDIYVLKNADETLDSLSDILTIVLLMKNSPWIKPIQRRANELETKINSAVDALEQWLRC
jgi:hypothetical protein